jgi:SAM-dependent methyltransferase
VSKRDDDSGVHSTGDMEAGMTTAERRRRRRRGGGLRVPSDNVPRRSTTPPVVAPVPEDPSLAMSIAYSFTSDASEPVPRVSAEANSQSVPSFADPMAPDAVSTVIDPPNEGQDFEMKTREMNAVDLEALGLSDPSTSGQRPAMQRVATEPSPSTVEVDMDMGAEEGPTVEPTPPPPSRRLGTEPSIEQPPPPLPRTQTRERLKTVALSDDDLEEVREAYRAATGQPMTATSSVNAPIVSTPISTPASALVPTPTTSSTQPLSSLDVEVQVGDAEEKPESLAEIDINELAMRADSSGEFEVDVDEQPLKSVPQATSVTPPPPSPSADRKRPASVPPPFSGDKAPRGEGHPTSVPPPFQGKDSKPDLGAVVPVQVPPPAAHPGHSGPHHAPPPPPPAAAHKHAPPAPPPKTKPTPSTQSQTQSKIEGKGSRGKPWFVDLFDEDYLRTLPFLTPQATQSEAEFVIEAMGLQPGAQVLDIGCGYGRHAMELAARGFHVVGLDLSTPLLVRGGEEAMRRGLEINFVRGDMRELDFDAQFDGAYCMFSTFGYFDDETNKKTVSNIARALKPGGRVMIEILNRDYVIADLPTRVWWEGEGCVVLEEVELNYFSSRIQVNRSVVFDDGRQLEQEISVRAYSLHEVGKLMHAAGFRVLEVSGGYHTRGRFFGNQSRHIIVLAERKDPSAT